MRAESGQKTKYGGLVRHDLFISKLVKPVFYKTVLIDPLNPFSARFFHAYRAGLARLGPLRAELG